MRTVVDQDDFQPPGNFEPRKYMKEQYKPHGHVVQIIKAYKSFR